MNDELPPAESNILYRAAELTEIGGGEGISYRQIGTARESHVLQILFERYESGADTGVIMLRHEGEEAASFCPASLRCRSANRPVCWDPETPIISTAGSHTGFATWVQSHALWSVPAVCPRSNGRYF